MRPRFDEIETGVRTFVAKASTDYQIGRARSGELAKLRKIKAEGVWP